MPIWFKYHEWRRYEYDNKNNANLWGEKLLGVEYIKQSMAQTISNKITFLTAKQ